MSARTERASCCAAYDALERACVGGLPLNSDGRDPSPGPLARRRWHSLDALRGMAILGIAIANARLYLGPVRPQSGTASPVTLLVEAGAQWVLGAAEALQLYMVFALLFGYGLQRQLDRDVSGGVAYVVRRLLVLAVIGAAHAAMLWYGDILLTYAVAGLVLLAFNGVAPATRRRLAVILLLVWPVLLLTVGLPEPPSLPTQAQRSADREQVMAYQSPDVQHIVLQRGVDTARQAANNFLALPAILGMMLLGADGARGTWLQHGMAASKRHAFIHVLLMFGGLGCVLVGHAVAPHTAQALALALLGAPVFALAGVVWLLGREQAGHILPCQSTLGALGRGAITSYLLQSAIFTSLAYGYGGATYGMLSYGGMLLVALLVAAACAMCARAWFRRWPLGPVEWLWRCAARCSRDVGTH